MCTAVRLVVCKCAQNAVINEHRSIDNTVLEPARIFLCRSYFIEPKFSCSDLVVARIKNVYRKYKNVKHQPNY